MLAVSKGGKTPADVGVSDIEDPQLGHDEVLIRVGAAGMNPHDLSVAVTSAETGDLTHVPGRDLAGTVVDGPPDWIGARVWATGGEFGTRRQGFHAELVTLPLRAVRPTPDNLTDLEAATVGVAFTTAYYALIDIGRLTWDDTVLVTGAAGAVGRAAVQIARWRGARHIIGIVRSAEDAVHLGALGVDLVVTDLDATKLRAELGHGSTLSIDGVGGELFNSVVAMTETNGRIVNFATPGDGHINFDLRTFYRYGLTLQGLNSGIRDMYDGARVLQELAPGFKSGDLHASPIAHTFTLGDAPNAYQALATRPKGKVVLVADS